MVHLAALRNGLELPYVERGHPDGVRVVLLHAWLDSRRCFDELMAALPERIHVLAFDRRGHGVRDFADDVRAFMDAVGLPVAVLVGASSGGYVAQRVPSTTPAGRWLWRYASWTSPTGP